jgi:glycosyltransferase involved in cell wall biosynthesis
LRDLVVVMAAHNEIRRRGMTPLRRSLASLERAMFALAKAKPGIDVYVCCCDDGSDDGTGEAI